MKKASTVFVVFAAVTFVAQWLVPLTMITGQEVVLKKGQEIKIRCQPIDPYDPFRGRYVRVRLDLSLPEDLPLPEDWNRQQRLFAILGTDADGFAEVRAIVLDEPEQGLYVRGQKQQWGNTFDLGLDRYYMNERLAPEAERLLRSGIGDIAEVWASLRIWEGRAVLGGLYVDGVPIEDYAGSRLNQSE